MLLEQDLFRIGLNDIKVKVPKVENIISLFKGRYCMFVLGYQNIYMLGISEQKVHHVHWINQQEQYQQCCVKVTS